MTQALQVGVVVVIGAAVLGLGGCGTAATVNVDGAQKAVATAVARGTKVTAKNVKCPSGVEATVDAVFDCTYTASNGVRYVAHLKITDVKDGEAQFSITSDRA